jgi:CBS domain-containing protein
MNDRMVGCILVSHDHQIVGIVTDRDLATMVLGFDQPSDLPIGEIMTSDIAYVHRGAVIEDVIKVMEVNGIRRVPVLDRTKNGLEQCIGLVTLDDLLAAKTLSIETCSRIVRTQMMRRIHHRHHKDTALDEGREQTFENFLSVIAKHIGQPKSITERIFFFLIKEVVQKIPPVNAAHFISQLPSLIQEDILSLPAGPQRQRKAKDLVSDFVAGFQLQESQARSLIGLFWGGLKVAINPEIVHYLEALLPTDFRNLFYPAGGWELAPSSPGPN